MTVTAPSSTALTAAAARAAHLIVDRAPFIFADTLAARLLGEQADELLGYHRSRGGHPVLAGARAQVTYRSRYTEDRLAAAVRRGVDQYVILGAGLDSFAYRSPLAARVRVFEVDRPATQDWKRAQLSTQDIPVPAGVAYVPVDLAAGTLADRLAGAGFDRSRPALVSWLGVTMYLTRAAIGETLCVLGGLAPGTEVVLDHMLPEQLRDPAGQSYVEQVAPVAAGRGEPWLTFLGPDQMSALLAEHGLEPVAQVTQRDALDPALWQRTDVLRPARLSQLARARVPVTSPGRRCP